MRLPFPLIRDLPPLLNGGDWSWERFAPSTGSSNEFWVGESPDGNRWLVKLTGSFSAWREHTFAGLAQQLGLSCQSSTFLILPPGSPPLANADNVEAQQLAIWLIPKHDETACRASCPIESLHQALRNLEMDGATALLDSSIRFAPSWLLGEVLGYFCGAGEIGERLFTLEHELILIDNEQAFSSGPAELSSCPWLYPGPGRRSEPAFALALDLARRFSALPDEELRRLVALPHGYRVQRLWGLASRLRSARAAARAFVRSENRGRSPTGRWRDPWGSA
jgi:hypothetical protein